MRTTNIMGQSVTLRALEPEDLDLMYVWENDTSEWVHSSTRVPYSRHQLELFIESQSQELDSNGQLRFVVCRAGVETFRGEGVIRCAEEAIGMVDIFEYDPYNHHAGVGIYIDPAFRGEGYAVDALLTMEVYLAENFELRQLWCNILSDNFPSIELFKKCGYKQAGIKREWRRRGKTYYDELLFQKIIITK